LPPVEGIFYDGQIFDAYKFVNDLIRSAKQRIVLIDNYIDDSVLQMIDKRQNSVSAVIYTKSISAQLQLDIQKHNAQYEPIVVQEFANSHDRFLCIDDIVYHIGASLKDLGKKWFAFNKMSISADQLLNKII
jgi:transposase-like protein